MDEPLHGFRVYSRQVSGIRVSVGISVLDIEKKHKVVPAVHVYVRLYWSRHLWSSSSSTTTTVRKKGTLSTSSWRLAHTLDSFVALPSAKRFPAKS